jgi:nicotinamide phosphoribosyltransferase
MTPILYTDYYKTEHHRMYPEGTTMIYSNLTPRKSRIKGINSIVVFGIQHLIKKYFLGKFQTNFFDKKWEEIDEEYKYAVNVDTTHIKKLHELGYLPLKIKALPEGSRCPIKVPCMTIRNTHPDFYWLTNYLETLISCQLWQPMTSATIAAEYWKILSKYAKETTGSTDFVQWQAHDFSMRGLSSLESAILSGMAHLATGFTGTDTIPAIYALKSSYKGEGLIGASVPATEHSVMCMGQKDDEIGTFSRLLDLYPTGILSVVSDTWDLWKVLTEYLPKLKDKIQLRGDWSHNDGRTFHPFVEYNEKWEVVRKGFRDSSYTPNGGIEYGVEWVMNNKEITHVPGKLVIRPDSGDPVDIICGINVSEPISLENIEKWYPVAKHSEGFGLQTAETYTVVKNGKWEYHPMHKGVIELLWDTFGGTTTEQGYKVLDSHIGAIYGDSITMERATEICERLKAKGFASTNIVFGVGSFTYQLNTRDTFGFAMKATYGEVMVNRSENPRGPFTKEGRAIFKDPVTDDGTKKSARGLLMVYDDDGLGYQMADGLTWEGEAQGALETVFEDGKLVKEYTLEEIRERVKQAS